MLGQDQSGRSTMVFCHGISMADHSEAQASLQICSFAPSASPASLAVVVALGALVQTDIVLRGVRAGRLASESRVLRAQNSRGPPMLA
jgi:hypothetical protein